jgi:hypothetical protein
LSHRNRWVPSGTLDRGVGLDAIRDEALGDCGAESKLLAEIPSEGSEKGWEFRCKKLGQVESFRCFFGSKQEQAELKNEVTTNPIGVKELLVKGLFESNGSGSTLSGSFAILLPGGALSIINRR